MDPWVFLGHASREQLSMYSGISCMFKNSCCALYDPFRNALVDGSSRNSAMLSLLPVWLLYPSSITTSTLVCAVTDQQRHRCTASTDSTQFRFAVSGHHGISCVAHTAHTSSPMCDSKWLGAWNSTYVTTLKLMTGHTWGAKCHAGHNHQPPVRNQLCAGPS